MQKFIPAIFGTLVVSAAAATAIIKRRALGRAALTVRNKVTAVVAPRAKRKRRRS